MAFRAKSLDASESPAQNTVQTAAVKLLDELTPFVMAQTGLDEAAARKQARQWAVECVCELLAAHGGADIVFLA